MHILVTNDDGVTAPGLLALAHAMRALGTVSVVAPDRNWSASGHVKTLERPLRVKETLLEDGTPALASDGAPSDCVALALLGLLPQPVDLVVSGINPYENVGHDVTYSGTVTAAMEAVIGGIPGVAVSLYRKEEQHGVLDYTPAARIARRIVQDVIAHGLPKGVLLNVNVPYVQDVEQREIVFTRQGLRVYRDLLDERRDPRGRPYYWIGGEAPIGVEENGTDIGALMQGCVSVTPLHLDLTAYPVLEMLKSWQIDSI